MSTYILVLVVQLLTAQVGAATSDAVSGTIYGQRSFRVGRPLHDIEIRTRRTRNGKTRVCYYISTGQGSPCEVVNTPKHCPDLAWCTELYDATKTLYIDGQKWGVIRETEEK